MRFSNYLAPWTFLCLDLLALFLIYQLGFYEFIMSDTSYISAGIVGLYVASNAFLFALVYADNHSPVIREWLSRMSWWIVQLFQGLGLFGTLLGFYYIFKLFFPELNFTDIEQFQGNLTNLLPSLAIALITSITGIASSIIFSFKLTFMNNATEV